MSPCEAKFQHTTPASGRFSSNSTSAPNASTSHHSSGILTEGKTSNLPGDPNVLRPTSVLPHQKECIPVHQTQPLLHHHRIPITLTIVVSFIIGWYHTFQARYETGFVVSVIHNTYEARYGEHDYVQGSYARTQ